MRRVLVCIVVVGACAVAGLAAGASKPPPFAQQGNYRPVSWMRLHDARDLADNLVAPTLGNYDDGYSNLYFVYGTGFKWIRMSGGGDVLGWENVERRPGVYTVDSRADAVITDLARSGTTIVFTLDIRDEEKPDLVSAQRADAYSRWVGFMVGHFRGRIGYYEILNEPDTKLSAEQYVDVVERVIPVIRTKDPKARIVIGAGAGVWTHDYPGYGGHGRNSMDLDYLKAVFGSPVAHLVDVLAWHPFYGSRADDPYYRTYPQTVADLQAVARNAGFTGRFMAAEMGWIPAVDVNASDNNNTLRFPEPVAVKYLLRTTVFHRGLGMITALAPSGGGDPARLITMALHADNQILAGAAPTTIPLILRSHAQLMQRATFRYKNGDALVALWTDGLPRNTDPGIAATLTLPGQAGHTATVLDPLRQRQQRLVTTSHNGTMIVRGFLIRDYPLFIRLRG